MDIAENVFLGREIRRRGVLGSVLRMVDKRAMAESARSAMAELNIGVGSMRQPVETLSGGQRQGVAVARSAAFARHVIILDEPTAALGVAQTAQVLRLITRLKERGLGVIVISHNLRDVFEVVDRIWVMRLGANGGEFDVNTTNEQEVVAAITGLTGNGNRTKTEGTVSQ
jgi:ABC-type sugar transport system ATPase subunit